MPSENSDLRICQRLASGKKTDWHDCWRWNLIGIYFGNLLNGKTKMHAPSLLALDPLVKPAELVLASDIILEN